LPGVNVGRRTEAKTAPSDRRSPRNGDRFGERLAADAERAQLVEACP